MENILNDLNSAVESKNDREILKNLKNVIEQADNLEVNEIGTFVKVLNVDLKTIQVVAAESIAELCKTQGNRRVFTNEDIINKLMHFMDSGSSELMFTTLRALGNICYENEEACNLVDKIGIDSIMSALRDDSNRDSVSLTTKVAGLLVNLLSTHDNLPKTALKGGILPVIERLLNKYKDGSIEDNTTIIMFLLSILNSLTEYLDDKEYIFNEKLAQTVINIFKSADVPEIGVLCLEIFHPLSEKDEIKFLLAKEGVCEHLYDLIEKYRDKFSDEESRSVLKMACELIVLILTEDAGMDMLYNDGKGKTYQNMLMWLGSDDPDLLSTGILAIGNFARKDSNCIQIVKNGVAKTLIDILSVYNNSTDLSDVKVQHALLSTLKNLVIPKENKAQAIKDNIIEVLYPMLNQDRLMVVFKLLGLFRMVIDGQPDAALYLLSRNDFIERLVYWCYNSDHLGVRGEVPRIFSWLIKNASSADPFPSFISVKDSVKCIVEMISSNHALMQNESFVALSILSATLSRRNCEADLDRFYQSLCDAEIGKNLNFVLNKYGEKWDEHSIENCSTLLERLVVSPIVEKELKDQNIADALEKLKNNQNARKSLERLETISETLKK